MTAKEAQKKFMLVVGGKATNPAPDIPFHKLMIDQKSFRRFRNTMVFGSGVNIGKDKFAKSKAYVTSFKVEDLVKRLIDTINAPQCWSQLAKQLIISQSPQTATLISRQATPRTILETYAQWLLGDMIDLYFDWFTLGYTCGKIRGAMQRLFYGKETTWDESSFVMPDGIPKPTMEPTIDILLRDKQYPEFLDTAFRMRQAVFLKFLRTKPHTGLEPDNCILAIGKYNRVTAIALEASGPLSLRKLFKFSPRKDWKLR
jgi:hypothetical protein